MISVSSVSNYFFTEEKPSGYTYTARYVFNSEAYLKEHEQPALSYYLADTKSEKITGLIHFFRRENRLISPGQGSFGGFEFHEDHPIVKEEFITYVLDQIMRKDNSEIKIRLYPEAYSPGNAGLSKDLLMKNNFKLVLSEPNHHIEVDSREFHEKICKMELRKLKKSTNFQFREETPLALSRVYEFILLQRKLRGQELSMSWEQVLNVSRELPGLFRIFTVLNAGEIIAASISVVVSENILYNFYPASSQDWKKESPMVYLTRGIYEFCQNHGFRILDLGTSWLDHVPNNSLIKFKENIGGILSYRYTFLNSRK